jgi:hypothetical protein
MSMRVIVTLDIIEVVDLWLLVQERGLRKC